MTYKHKITNNVVNEAKYTVTQHPPHKIIIIAPVF